MKWSVKVLSALFVCLSVLSSQSFAATVNVDAICAKVPGHWKGLYVIKDENKCATHNGCSHFMSIEMTDSGNSYQALIQPDLTGAGGPISVDCNNGKLTSSNFPKGTVIHMNCSANNECTMNTETPFIFAYLHKAE